MHTGQDLANMFYGLALMGIDDHAIWEDALLPRSQALVSTFDHHSLTNVIWSLGTLQKHPTDGAVLSSLLSQAIRLIDMHEASSETPKLLPKPEYRGGNALVEKAPSKPASSSLLSSSRLQPQFISNITWSLARLQHHDAEFMQRAGALFPCLADAATAQNIANVLWAFASLECPGEHLFNNLRPRVERILMDQGRGLSPQSLSNMAWSYAKAGQVNFMQYILEHMTSLELN